MMKVYALVSKKDGYLYIGLSEDVNRRLLEHNSGYSKSTKHRRPFEVIYVENCADRKTARTREKYLKSGIGREYLKKLIPR
ncbi:MAG: GIY-YIG nuclease family protein [Candidatus Omnitrophica bacterium]|nr:GIY-YIG nuclease family protein [Candidatus Omnitrophota bacterium]